jgi:hypothetical protein
MHERLNHPLQVKLSESEVQFLEQLARENHHRSRSGELRKLLRERMASDRPGQPQPNFGRI